MIHMKKQWITSGFLIALDQAVKLAIAFLAGGRQFVLIDAILRFEPHQNTHLNWLASMLKIKMPVLLMIALQLLLSAALILFYRYSRYSRPNTSRYLNLGFCTALAGIGCSFADVVFWGGSLDYLKLFDWFVFDIKDVYLNIGWIGIVLWLNSKAYKKDERHAVSFWSWLKAGKARISD